MQCNKLFGSCHGDEGNTFMMTTSRLGQDDRNGQRVHVATGNTSKFHSGSRTRFAQADQGVDGARRQPEEVVGVVHHSDRDSRGT